MIKINCCLDCTQRKQGCHSVCIKYLAESLSIIDAKSQQEQIRKENELLYGNVKRKYSRKYKGKGAVRR